MEEKCHWWQEERVVSVVNDGGMEKLYQSWWDECSVVHSRECVDQTLEKVEPARLPSHIFWGQRDVQACYSDLTNKWNCIRK